MAITKAFQLLLALVCVAVAQEALTLNKVTLGWAPPGQFSYYLISPGKGYPTGIIATLNVSAAAESSPGNVWVFLREGSLPTLTQYDHAIQTSIAQKIWSGSLNLVRTYLLIRSPFLWCPENFANPIYLAPLLLFPNETNFHRFQTVSTVHHHLCVSRLLAISSECMAKDLLEQIGLTSLYLELARDAALGALRCFSYMIRNFARK